MASQLTDAFARKFYYLRLSITDVCNFRCTYCLPDGFQARAGRPQPLTREEIARLLRGFAGVGLRKLRLTGGERGAVTVEMVVLMPVLLATLLGGIQAGVVFHARHIAIAKRTHSRTSLSTCSSVQ